MDGGENLQANCALLVKLEDEADHISHYVMQAIRRSFITSFDCADIRASMDDAIDQMNKTAKAVLL